MMRMMQHSNCAIAHMAPAPTTPNCCASSLPGIEYATPNATLTQAVDENASAATRRKDKSLQAQAMLIVVTLTAWNLQMSIAQVINIASSPSLPCNKV